MCGDPVATIYIQIAEWIAKTDFGLSRSGKKLSSSWLRPEEVLDCMWYEIHGNSMTRYHISIGNITIPDDMPEKLKENIQATLKEFING